ncbi:hypothetical protein EGT07_26715 [Herbaspirillum sp. HC18]|nr:hypothetical protein EGT07_26715 [Herbaspirillum sp. HC18]
MKYMGSKRSMLGNGLGELLLAAVPQKNRFIDLFCGSGAVATHVAVNFPIETFAFDLQQYAVTLAGSSIGKTTSLRSVDLWRRWLDRANVWLEQTRVLERARDISTGVLEKPYKETVASIEYARRFCAELSSDLAFAKAYGGYYFSPLQALMIDALRCTVPDGASRTSAIAALIRAASRCSASPGHTAQPFSLTETALPHLIDAWRRDFVEHTKSAFADACQTHALVTGAANVADAVDATELLQETDIVFIDPPYSEVQYSRFYHVLESIAIGRVGEVSGTGRYPPLVHRPQSRFCRVSQSIEEFDRLMLSVAAFGAEAIVTFPADQASNGLSGEVVEAISDQYFRIERRKISSSFSTLGGNTRSRAARKQATELLLHLTPR